MMAGHLYSPALFRLVDPVKSRQWHTWFGEDGERYSYPEELQRPSFFEDYFDGNRKVMATLHHYLAMPPQSRETTKRKAG